MAIPQAQLQTWTKQGATVSAQNAHTAIRNALDAYEWPQGKKPSAYLQGSYANTTNIYGNSDVDLVVQSDSTYFHDISALPANQQAAFNGDWVKASYTWDTFRKDVHKALVEYFITTQPKDAPKCIKVESANFKTDVVPCMQYRKYLWYNSAYDYQFIEGMQFWVQSEARWVVNFPKLHLSNGETRNSQGQTNGLYKPAVRMFKNARTYLVKQRVINDGTAPSYFLECLLYNVPVYLFTRSEPETFRGILAWLLDNSITGFVCQNEQVYLFGDSPEQWNLQDAYSLINGLAGLWNNWG